MVSKKKKKEKNWEDAKYFKQILFNKNTNHSGNDDQNWEIGNTRIDHTKHGNIISTAFANRIKKYLNNECIKIGAGLIQHVTIESKHGFLKSTGFKLKES